MPRSFSVPLGGVRIRGWWIGVTPLLGILFCLIMIVPLFADMARALIHGNPVPALLLLAYAGLGFATYRFYSQHNSRFALSDDGAIRNTRAD